MRSTKLTEQQCRPGVGHRYPGHSGQIVNNCANCKLINNRSLFYQSDRIDRSSRCLVVLVGWRQKLHNLGGQIDCTERVGHDMGKASKGRNSLRNDHRTWILTHLLTYNCYTGGGGGPVVG